MTNSELTAQIIGAAIEIHEALGPGLLESAYERALEYELALRGMSCARQVGLPLRYKNLDLERGYRLDMVVAGAVVVEVKSVSSINPVHVKQVLTYLRLSGLRVGLILNFNVRLMKEGIKRVISEHDEG